MMHIQNIICTQKPQQIDYFIFNPEYIITNKLGIYECSYIKR